MALKCGRCSPSPAHQYAMKVRFVLDIQLHNAYESLAHFALPQCVSLATLGYTYLFFNVHLKLQAVIQPSSLREICAVS